MYPASKTVITTESNAWTLAFSVPTDGRVGVTGRAYDTNTAAVCVARVRHGAAAPTSTPWSNDDQSDIFKKFIAGEDPYPMGSLMDYTVDVYVCAADGSAGQKIALWEEKQV